MKRAIIAIYNFYVEGFRSMTWGRQLWWLILLKVPIVGSLPGSTIPGILQARTLEWVAISFSNARK